MWSRLAPLLRGDGKAKASAARRLFSIRVGEPSSIQQLQMGKVGAVVVPVAAASYSKMPTTNWNPPPDTERMGTADLCDVYLPDPVDVTVPRQVKVATPGYFRDYGKKLRFHGPMATVLCFENNPLVRAALEEPGEGRVLVVDAGASKRCAVLGDNLAEMGAENGWAGIIINGCCRDSEDIGRMDIGVKAIGTHPLKSSKRDKGMRDVPVSFAGVEFKPGAFVYADGDGVLVSDTELTLT